MQIFYDEMCEENEWVDNGPFLLKLVGPWAVWALVQLARNRMKEQKDMNVYP